MACVMEIVDGGVATTVQDGGRPGYRSFGVAISGALDPLWLACANALVGNPRDAAALEMRVLGPRLRLISGRLRVALVGAVDGRLERADGRTTGWPAWRSATMEEGDTLHVGAMHGGVAYLALSGGIDVPLQLGSRSTHVRAHIGGIEGHALRRGDRMQAGSGGELSGLELTHAYSFAHESGAIRVMLGPQDDHFTDEALAAFVNTEYVVTRDVDRMGIRLEGPPLAHDPGKGAEIVSDGVTPGAIQVPPNGQPIVLLADCQTVGGYPKIATVIRADLPCLAHLMPGRRVRFSIVTRRQALSALSAQAADLDAWIAGIVPFHPAASIDENALYCANLISGVVDACGGR